MKKNKPKILNQRGMSLVEVIVAMAISSIVSMAVMKTNQTGMKGMSTVSSKISLKMWQSTTLFSKLSDPDTCMANFGSMSVASGGSRTSLVEADGSTTFATAGDEIDGTGGDYRLAPTSPGPVVVMKPFEESTPGSTKGRCDVEIHVERIKDGFGPNSQKIIVPMICTTVSDQSSYRSCAVSTDGSDSLWSLQLAEAGPPVKEEYIFTTKNVLIGQSGADAKAPFQIDSNHGFEWPSGSGSNVFPALKITPQEPTTTELNALVYETTAMWEASNCLTMGFDDAGDISTSVSKFCENGTILSGDGASGYESAATGDNSVVLGASNVTVSGNYAAGFGIKNIVSGQRSMTVGLNNNIAGQSSLAVGNQIFQGVMGLNSLLSGSRIGGPNAHFTASITGGSQNFAKGYIINSLISGEDNSVETITDALAVGENNRVANCQNCFAIGKDITLTDFNNSLVLGTKSGGLSATNANQIVMGAPHSIQMISKKFSLSHSHQDFSNVSTDTVAIDLGVGNNFNDAGASGTPPHFAIALGRANTVLEGDNIAMGWGNEVDDRFAIAMGVHSAATDFGSVAIGDNCRAEGRKSFCFGKGGNVTHDGAMILGSGTTNAVGSSANNQLTMRFEGGVKVYTNAALDKGAKINPGATIWTGISDRNAKKNFEKVDGEYVLRSIQKMEIPRWVYKHEEKNYLGKQAEHIGPMAQDFWAAFGIGYDDKGIGTLDISGVNMKGIQALTNRTDKLENENKQLKIRVERLEKLVNQLIEDKK